MSAIQMRSIEKSFGETPVLRNVDLSIRAGEFLTLVGPSGCGKSTLLRILAGLEAPSAGSVVIGDRTVNGVRAANRNLAMVFQSYALYPHLTIAENMKTPLRLRDLSFTERLPFAGPLIARDKHRKLQEQVEETAKVLRIEGLLNRKPGQLSGGQRQRAALGRAMVRKPVAFLMDEPLSNLDAALRIHMRSELAELHRSLRTTFVYVTHDQAEALTMSDRMAVMMDGDILQLGSPEDVYNNPQDIRVAEFVGAPKINLLPGEVDEAGHARCGEVALSRVAAGAASGEVRIGLRPEHLAVVERDEPGALTGRLVHRENLGADLYLHLAMADGKHRMVVRTGVHESGHIAVGDDVTFVRKRGEAMVFGRDGKRLSLSEAPRTSIPEVA
ncbi:ABC transporter ATP-binding protein [Roseibium aggregatum]|uniref:ABC transporter ATP-binding protein n=1 Tax=Roseibium aggregatum TaxID=187304 RepID=A0A939EFD8_9HYPH|nr:ABC transporter ATP-binding protein [Roseibium aggregatum]MBN9671973.1 ABC transporter ATP-binding protein [Roseibium aggregatum]